MVDDILAAIADLFASDRTLMILVAVGAIASAAVFIFLRIKNVRDDVQRRVSGAEEPMQTRSAPAKPALRERLGGLVGSIAESLGQTDEAQTRVLRARLIQAGIYDKQAVVWFFGLRIVSAIVMAAAAFGARMYFAPDSSHGALALYSLIGAGLGIVVPSFLLDRRISKLQLEHSSGFPDFMDLMVVCAQAGLSMEAGINRIAAEISVAFPSLARNLDMAARELLSGKPLAKCIESLAVRLGIPEASSFSTLLQQSEELGSSLTQSLRTYSDDMRNKRLMKAEEKAYSLPAKLVVPLTLFVFPVLLVVLMLPIAVSVSVANI